MDESATCKVTDRREALQGSATVLFTDPRPRIPITFMKARLVNGFSIAFEVTQGHLDGEVRHLIKLRMRSRRHSSDGTNRPRWRACWLRRMVTRGRTTRRTINKDRKP